MSGGPSRARRAALWCGGVAVVAYAAWRLQRSARLQQLRSAAAAATDVLAASSDVAASLSQDLRAFVKSDTDEVPQSVRQLLRLAACPEAGDCIASWTSAFVRGIATGVQTPAAPEEDSTDSTSDSGEPSRPPQKPDRTAELLDRVLDRVLTSETANFASVVVGAAVREAVTAYFSCTENAQKDAASSGPSLLEHVLNIASSRKGKQLVHSVITVFVQTAVHSYIDKTKEVNYYDELFASISKPEYGPAVTQVVRTFCNEVVSSYVKASAAAEQEQKEADAAHKEECNGFDDRLVKGKRPSHERADRPDTKDASWMAEVCRVARVPENRGLVKDVAGTVSSEAVHTILRAAGDFVRARGQKPGAEGVRIESACKEESDGLVWRGVKKATYVAEKSFVCMSACAAMCLYIASAPIQLVLS